MPEGVYDTLCVAGETDYELPRPATELHESQYIELQQLSSVYNTAILEEQRFYDESFRPTDLQENPYMELSQQESVYETLRPAEYEVRFHFTSILHSLQFRAPSPHLLKSCMNGRPVYRARAHPQFFRISL